jgi:acyl CoA:acetate/3-ketoacid CoA transferase
VHDYDILRYLASCSQLQAQRSAAGAITSLLAKDGAGRPGVLRQVGLRTVVRLATSDDDWTRTVAAIAVDSVNTSVLLAKDEFPRPA